jgi:hypothetical protein
VFVPPLLVEGAWLGRTQHQAFARTAAVLEIGMCGGPVLLARAGAEPRVCVGMTEGIVGRSRPTLPSTDGFAGQESESLSGRAEALLAGSAAVIDGSIIAEFVRRNS